MDKLCEVVCDDQQSHSTRVSAYSCIIFTIEKVPKMVSKNVNNAIEFILVENNDEMASLTVNTIHNLLSKVDAVQLFTNEVMILLTQIPTTIFQTQKDLLDIIERFYYDKVQIPHDIYQYLCKFFKIMYC